MSATELVKVGLKSSLATAAIDNGTWKFTSDTKELYFENNNVRFPISDIVTGNTEAQIEAIAAADALPKIYVSSDTNKLFYYNNGWHVVGGDSVDYASSATYDGNGAEISATYETQAHASSMVTYLEGLIADINSFEIQVVDSIDDLPDHDQKSNILYFVPNTKAGTNVYDEYIWVIDDATTEPKTGHYECIGSSAISFDNYYTKAESDAKFATTATTAEHASSISDLEVALGTSGSSTATSALGRIDVLEADVDALENASTALEGRVAANETAIGNLQAATVAIASTVSDNAGRIEALETDVASIHRYDIVEVAELPATGQQEYTIYMVPEVGGGVAGDNYAQYVWVANPFTYEEDGVEKTIPAGWQRIDSSSAFANYYTKAEVDSMVGAATADIAGLDTRVTEAEAKFGAMAASTAAGFKTVEARLSDEEAATLAHASSIGTLEGRADGLEASTAAIASTVSSNEGRLDDLEEDIYGPESGSTASSILGRLDTDEAAIAALQNGSTALEGRVDALEASTASIATTVSANETAIGNLQAATATINGTVTDNTERITDLENGSTALEARVAAAEGDIDDLEAGLGTSADASSQTTAFGRIAKIDETIGSSTVSGAILPRLDALTEQVASINLFDIQIVESLPAVGTEFVIYFVADTPDPSGELSTYKEYMWIPDEGHEGGGYYEQIGITKANLDDYYTKDEADARFATTAAGEGLAGRMTEVEAKLGDMAASTAAGFTSVEDRLAAEEAATTAATTRMNNIEVALGTSGTSTATSALGRIDALEADVDALENASTALEGRVDTAEGKIEVLEGQVNGVTGGSTADSILGRLDSLEDELESHDFNYAGAASEGGAAIKVEETASTASAEREVLVANDDKDAVEYASNVTVNPTTGAVKANALVLGDCTLSYDSTSQAVVFTYA